MKNKLILVIMWFAIFCCILTACSDLESQKIDDSRVLKTILDANVKKSPILFDEMNINNITSLYDEESKIVKDLGKPNSVLTYKLHEDILIEGTLNEQGKTYKYEGLELSLYDLKTDKKDYYLDQYTLTGDKYISARHISVGMKFEDVLNLLPIEEKYMSLTLEELCDTGANLYDMKSPSSKGHDYGWDSTASLSYTDSRLKNGDKELIIADAWIVIRLYFEKDVLVKVWGYDCSGE